jgi:hypothetical protein
MWSFLFTLYVRLTLSRNLVQKHKRRQCLWFIPDIFFHVYYGLRVNFSTACAGNEWNQLNELIKTSGFPLVGQMDQWARCVEYYKKEDFFLFLMTGIPVLVYFDLALFPPFHPPCFFPN